LIKVEGLTFSIGSWDTQKIIPEYFIVIIISRRVPTRNHATELTLRGINLVEELFNLNRFVVAQEKRYPTVIEELNAGKKISHWMWFIFPQVTGLGRTEIAKRLAIESIDEAKAYISQPLLGSRLQECTDLVLAIDGKSANDIFGHPDDLKFKSSMTLFLVAAPQIDLFQRAINKYYDGHQDNLTIDLLDTTF
jgi:uncharacterized protein (DUF1810 family)